MEEGGAGQARPGQEGVLPQGVCVLPFSLCLSPESRRTRAHPALAIGRTAERKKLFLKAKFDELSTDKRKLHKAIDKKRKKTAQKEKKAMPNMRPSTGR